MSEGVSTSAYRPAGSRCRRAACNCCRPASGDIADRTSGRTSSDRRGTHRPRSASNACLSGTSPARTRCTSLHRTALFTHIVHPTNQTKTRRTIRSIGWHFQHRETRCASGWLCGRVPDLQWGGYRFESRTSHQGLLIVLSLPSLRGR